MVNESMPMVCLDVTKELVEEFREWLRRDNPRIKESTIKQYMYYVPRLVGLRLCGKDDVVKAFEAMGLNKSSYEAFSRFLTFVEKQLEGYEGLVYRLRKAMPRKPKSREDTYVPSDDKVLELARRLAARGPVYRVFYNILVSSGCRGTEARFLLEHARRLRAVDLGYGAVRVHMPPELQRGSKNEYAIYLPIEVWSQVRKLAGKRLPHQDTIEDVFRECSLPLKYIRKWWRTKAKLLGIDGETIEAFQGRRTTIGGKRYTDWIPILDKEYKKILPEVRKFIISC